MGMDACYRSDVRIWYELGNQPALEQGLISMILA